MTALAFSGNDGGYMHALTSALLLWRESDAESCAAVRMGAAASAGPLGWRGQMGSYALLWPVFVALCLGQAAETFECALAGRGVATETGMSLFEHAMAFSEAEATLVAALGLDKAVAATTTMDGARASADIVLGLGGGKGEGQQQHQHPESAVIRLTRNQILRHLDVSPALLLIVLLSAANALSTNLLAVAGWRDRTRLANTALWGLAAMAAILHGMITTVWYGVGFDDGTGGAVAGPVYFPSICTVAYVPHMVILVAIAACVAIYGIALCLTALSLPPPPPSSSSPPAVFWSLRARFAAARANLQGASQLHGLVQLRATEDFYGALVRIGYAALSAASEAVFLCEDAGPPVVAARMTWLEEERLDEVDALGMGRWRRGAGRGASGYAHEKTLEELEREGEPRSGLGDGEGDGGVDVGPGTDAGINNAGPAAPAPQHDGHYGSGLGHVGALTQPVRLRQVFGLCVRIAKLPLACCRRAMARVVARLIVRLGLPCPDALLDVVAQDKRDRHSADGSLLLRARRQGQAPGTRVAGSADTLAARQGLLDFWLRNDAGELELPADEQYDVEREMRRRDGGGDYDYDYGSDALDSLDADDPDARERRLDARLYDWWKVGGAWGELDASGDYVPRLPEADSDWDATSVVSASTAAEEEEAEEYSAWWEKGRNGSGRGSWGDYNYGYPGEDGYEDDGGEGNRTPTQRSPNYPLHPQSLSQALGRHHRSHRTRSADADVVPDTVPNLDSRALARLLDPHDSDARAEARILASHLLADADVDDDDVGGGGAAAGRHGGGGRRIMTRSRFREQTERERARVLTAGRVQPRTTTQTMQTQTQAQSQMQLRFRTAGRGKDKAPLGPLARPSAEEEEAELLERLILERRGYRVRGPEHEHAYGNFYAYSRDDDNDQNAVGANVGANAISSDASAADAATLQCVVCQAARRSVIAWPCRCLALCEGCRVELALHNYGRCVTCRREVKGFVRLWVP